MSYDLSEHEDELLESLVKSAVGYKYRTSRQTAEKSSESSPVKNIKQETDEVEVPPDPQIAQYLLTIIDEDRYTPDRIAKRKADAQAFESGMPMGDGW